MGKMEDRRTPKQPSSVGSTLQSFLMEEGIADEVDATARRRVLKWQRERARTGMLWRQG
jgi:hypothetical protein